MENINEKYGEIVVNGMKPFLIIILEWCLLYTVLDE